MLIYHPAYDLNHCVFRVLSLLASSTHKQFDTDLLRLLDFYVLFPHLLKTIKPFPSALKEYSKIIKHIPSSYEAIPNPKRILFDLEDVQNAAFHNLLARGIIDLDAFRSNLVVLNDSALPSNFLDQLTDNELANSDWFPLISDDLPLVGFLGKDGLKKRSSLMEYRYDNTNK
ncbi:MAG: ABC-three component system middle component 5 [Candidatus Thiodiazotropha taylori]